MRIAVPQQRFPRKIPLDRISGTCGVPDLRLRSTGWPWFFVRTDGSVSVSRAP